MHVPVLAEEVIEGLAVRRDGIYVDATYGRGGHSALLLSRLGPEGRLLASDRDPAAAQDARSRFAAEPRLEFIPGCFSQIAGEIAARGLAGKLSGILFDLGVSSQQLDEPERGFSFEREGPLDMRMDPASGRSLGEWLARASEREIADVIFRYGEERYSRRIARAIVARRRARRLNTTRDLAAVIASAVPRRPARIHPATRSFQAFRIFVNGELEELERVLPAVPDLLAPGGRFVVLSYHSLEDRRVKHFLRDGARREPPRLVTVTRLMRPGPEECRRNRRARSARLRVAERPA